ncbi:MAG: GNAT family N-acetyltransferase, partial [Candidatus Rokuibacteriota bacterium]
METIRRARPADLPLLHEIFYEQETAGRRDPPPRGPLPPLYRHELETGVVYVAEREGRVVGFAASISRGAVDFLTEFFVRLAFQADGIGRRLLRHVVPRNGRACFTSSSSDPRALALYIRAGLRPLFPCFYLRADGATGPLAAGGVEAVEAAPDDAALVD